MISSTHLEPVANTFLFLTNILSTVKIDKLVVPEVVATDCAEAVLECDYSGAGADVNVLWLHNGSRVYEWRRGSEPEASGLLEGRLDLTYRSRSGSQEKRAMRVVKLAPELSGEYTCVVKSRGLEARASTTMTVFSPEQEFELTFSSSPESDLVHIQCTAKHLYPQPDLTIEYNKVPIAQQQRTWREGAFFDATSHAALARTPSRTPAHSPSRTPPHSPPRTPPPAELACRLHLPLVDYTAITTKYLHWDNHFNGGSILSSRSHFIVGLIIFSQV